jgi:tRNA pseudouridine55 synthase
MEETKTYLATMKLGVETDTQDLTGRVMRESDGLPDPEAIPRLAADFVGEIQQTPPLYSAVHHQGERLYKLARRGEVVEAQPRPVTIHRLEIQEVALPLVTFLVECGKGAYIRTLAHDLGRALGCGAHLISLTRLAVGAFRLEEAVPLEVVEKTNLQEIQERLIPLAQCLPRFQAVQVDRQEARLLSQGRTLPWPEQGPGEGEKVRVVAEGNLVAVAAVRSHGVSQVLAPVRVFHTGVGC